MRYLSVCSGIEAASVAWGPLGWNPVAFSEIEPFPCAVLAHHYPNVPNWGDMTKFTEWPDATVDLLCGGTPCQSFSVAGLRKGLDDPRGSLMLTFGAIAAKYRPRWLVWENVPGVLSSNGGRDFGSFLGMLGQLGYGFAYRVLDAQYFGVAQRRRRVFVVGCLGDWQRAAAVLFERHSLSGHPAPRREAGQEVAKCLTRGAAQRFDSETETMIPVAFNWQSGGDCRGLDPAEITNALHCGQTPAALCGASVRRLTPRECERLQGFPDDYTLITSGAARKIEDDYFAYLRATYPDMGLAEAARLAKDGPRYKALGNSWAVPVVRWIGERITAVERIKHERRAA